MSMSLEHEHLTYLRSSCSSLKSTLPAQVRLALDTPLSPSELAVLLMLAGNACRGAAAWNDVEDVCFWSNNFSLPEFRVR